MSRIRIRLDEQYFGEGESLETFAEVSGLPLGRFSFNLSDLKAHKKRELVRAADEHYKAEIPAFMGVIVAAKYGGGGLAALSAPERAIFDKIKAGYDKLNSLLAQVDAAATDAEVLAINW